MLTLNDRIQQKLITLRKLLYIGDGCVYSYLTEYLIFLPLLLFSLKWKLSTTSLIHSFLKTYVKIQSKCIQNGFLSAIAVYRY